MTKAICVTPEVVSGIDRNGEDFYLSFECVEEAESYEIVPEDGKVGWDLELDEEGEVANLSCSTVHHCFKWEGTLDDLYVIAVKNGLLDQEKWEWFGPVNEPPKRRWRHKYFVDGNLLVNL